MHQTPSWHLDAVRPHRRLLGTGKSLSFDSGTPAEEVRGMGIERVGKGTSCETVSSADARVGLSRWVAGAGSNVLIIR